MTAVLIVPADRNAKVAPAPAFAYCSNVGHYHLEEQLATVERLNEELLRVVTRLDQRLEELLYRYRTLYKEHTGHKLEKDPV